jgi:hypothetical protein
VRTFSNYQLLGEDTMNAKGFAVAMMVVGSVAFSGFAMAQTPAKTTKTTTTTTTTTPKKKKMRKAKKHARRRHHAKKASTAPAAK